MFDWGNPTVVIVGVSSALGEAVAVSLAKDCPVIGTYNTRKPVRIGNLVSLHKVDVRLVSEMERFLGELPEMDGVVLVNMFGTNVSGMAHKFDFLKWADVFDVNTNGTFITCRAFLPMMRQQMWGRIINVSSIVGQVGVPGTAAYAASKQAIVGFTKALAAESARKDITANVLALGYFDRGMIEQVPEAMQNDLKHRIPAGRFGDPENIAEAIRFLIKADYVNGAVININGGLL